MSLNLAPYQTDAAAYVRDLFARQPEVKSAEVEVAGSEDVTVIFADGRHLGLHLSHAPDYHGGFDLDPATAKRCGYLTEEEAEYRAEDEISALESEIAGIREELSRAQHAQQAAEESTDDEIREAIQRTLELCESAVVAGTPLPDEDTVLSSLH